MASQLRPDDGGAQIGDTSWLDDPATRAACDPDGMLDDLANAGADLAAAFQLGIATAPALSPRRIIVAGMGASGIVGDVLSTLADSEGVLPITATHRPILQTWVTPQDLVMAISYSGETREVLSLVEESAARGIPIVTVTGGGRLAAWATSEAVPILPVTVRSQPRAAFAAMLGLSLAACVRAQAFPEIDAAGAAASLSAASRIWRWDSPWAWNAAKRLATRLQGRIPTFVGAGHLASVAVRWSAQWAENGRSTSFHATTPELFHNAVEAFPDLAQRLPWTPVLLRDPHLSPIDREAIDLFAHWCASQGIAHEEAVSTADHRLASILELVQLGDLASAYTGMLRGERIAQLQTIPSLRDALRRPGREAGQDAAPPKSSTAHR